MRTLLLAATLAFSVSFIAVIVYVRFGGQAVKDFCSQSLIGKTQSEVRAMASQKELKVIERAGLLRVTTDPTMSRHTCDLKINAGNVISARAFFRF